jgi:hypothetical protein
MATTTGFSFSYACEETFKDIARHGTYYMPAWKHYGDNRKTVTCDKCKRANLEVCIGHKEFDLCLICAEKVVEANKLSAFAVPPPPFTFGGMNPIFSAPTLPAPVNPIYVAPKKPDMPPSIYSFGAGAFTPVPLERMATMMMAANLQR